MKKWIIGVVVIILLLLLSLAGFSQSGNGYQGSPYTYQSGTYSAELNSTINVAPNAIVTFSSLQVDGGSLTIGSGATVVIESLTGIFNASLDIKGNVKLIISSTFNVNGKVNVENGATLFTENDLNLEKGANILAGSITVQGNITLNQSNSLTMIGCATLFTQNLTNLSSDVVVGSGFIWIQGTYIGDGNQFTNSSQLSIRYAGNNMTGPDSDGHTPITPAGDVSPTAGNNCGVTTPVLLTNVSAQVVNGILDFKWTTTSETNNAYFQIQGSADGKTWVTVGTVQSYWPDGNGSVSHAYELTFNDITIVEAGLGVGIFLILGLSLGVGASKRTKFVTTLITIVALSGTVVACHKTNDLKKSLTYTQFRLQQVDKDGTVNYYQTIFKVGQ